MPNIQVDSEALWILYDEEDHVLLYVCTSRDDALFKMADLDELSSLQIAKVAHGEEGWLIDSMAWKDLVMGLIKKANKSVDYTESTISQL
jgi:hypothetical protein